MSNFDTTSTVKANKHHRCCECYGAINPGEQYERVFIVCDGDPSHFKTCKACCEAREWLLKETDWHHDVDGDGHSFFYTMLREHLLEQAGDGDRKFSFRAYRLAAGMSKRRKAYAEFYNAETLKIRERSHQEAAQ